MNTPFSLFHGPDDSASGSASHSLSPGNGVDARSGVWSPRGAEVVKGMVRVVLVDDSPVSLRLMERLLGDASQVQIVGKAANGREALSLLATTRPDVICTDDAMPVMDGLELTRRVMSEQPLPILVFCESAATESARRATLLNAGAVDVTVKSSPDIAFDAHALETASRALVSRVRRLAGVVVLSRRPAVSALTSPQTSPLEGSIISNTTLVTGSGAHSLDAHSLRHSQPNAPLLSAPVLGLSLIAVGSSTGGPHALESLLTPLPADFPLPILCVQHISVGFLQGLIDWLHARCALRVVRAQSGEKPQLGTVYFAPEEAHLLLDAGGRMQFSTAPAEDGHRPSATTLLRSVAERYGPNAAGVLLTGMGSDGAQGLLALSQAGGLTFAQDEASCVVYGMPAQAAKLGAARYVMPPAAIAQELMRRVGSRKRESG